jgi:hypothetical protein
LISDLIRLPQEPDMRATVGGVQQDIEPPTDEAQFPSPFRLLIRMVANATDKPGAYHPASSIF